MRTFPITPRTREQLYRMANPAIPGELEAQLGVLYDTQVFTSSTTSLSFFQTLQTSKNLGNLGAAGQIPDPNFFELYGLCLDINQLVTVTAAASAPAGALQDVTFILNGDAPTTGAEAPYIQLDKNGKIYGPYPLIALHALGGATGNGWGTETTATTGQYANNGVFDGGLPFNGSIVFTPREVFSWQIVWGGTVAVVASHALRLSMVGVYHRKVS
jgi:hypothetical protein